MDAAEFLGKPWYIGSAKPLPSVEVCSHCGNEVRAYRRHLYATMAASLTRLGFLTRVNPKFEWFHVDQIYKKRGDWTKLSWWDFILEKPQEAGRSKSSGLYKLTENGAKFVLGESRVPPRVVVRANTVLWWEGVPVNIVTALRSSFSYRELMEGGAV